MPPARVEPPHGSPQCVPGQSAAVAACFWGCVFTRSKVHRFATNIPRQRRGRPAHVHHANRSKLRLDLVGTSSLKVYRFFDGGSARTAVSNQDSCIEKWACLCRIMLAS